MPFRFFLKNHFSTLPFVRTVAHAWLLFYGEDIYVNNRGCLKQLKVYFGLMRLCRHLGEVWVEVRKKLLWVSWSSQEYVEMNLMLLIEVYVSSGWQCSLIISHTKINKKETTKISYCSISSILLTHFLGKIVTKILLTKLTKISGVFSNMKKRHLFLNYFYITRVQEITKNKK